MPTKSNSNSNSGKAAKKDIAFGRKDCDRLDSVRPKTTTSTKT